MRKRWPIILALALFFGFIWPTPYTSFRRGEGSNTENRIVRAITGDGRVGRRDWRLGPIQIPNGSAGWLVVWLVIGAAAGYGLTTAVGSRRKAEEVKR